MKPYGLRGLRQELGLTSEEYGKLYQSWKRMLNRCYDPNNASYEHYRKRGIEVSPEWKYSFENFLRWSLENGWEAKLSLDRIDNSSNYSPDNCRWTNAKVQARNRDDCIYITHNGVTKNMSEWCEIIGIPHYLAYNRYLRGHRNFDELFTKIDQRTGGVLHY